LRETLKVPSDYTIVIVVAAGYPNDNPVVQEFEGSVQYLKDKSGMLDVSKRRFRDILHRNISKMIWGCKR
jgi:hypothetical protein